MKKILFALAASAALTTSAMAASPVYMGVDAGASRIAGVPQLTDKSGTSGSAYVGMKVDKTWAAELGYTRAGDVKAGSAVIHPEMVTAQAVANHQLAKKVNVFAKGGVAYVHATGAHRSNEWAPVLGVGAEYSLTKNWATVAQLQFVHKPLDVGGNLVNASVGMKYKF